MVGLRTVGTLLVVFVAGCSSGGSAVEDTGPALPSVSIDPASQLCAIRGVVVDEAIRPVANATVKVAGTTLESMTPPDGTFAFQDLTPGTYFITASAPGLLEVQGSAVCVAGEVATSRISLPADRTPQPYHYTIGWDWYDEAGVTLVDFAVDLVDRAFLNDSIPPACDACYFYFQTDQVVHTFIIEAVWEVNVDNPLGNGDYYWVLDGLDSGEYEDDYFPSPGRVVLPAGALGNDTHFGIGMSADEEWITVEQKAELYITLFFAAPPPEGWSFVNGDP